MVLLAYKIIDKKVSCIGYLAISWLNHCLRIGHKIWPTFLPNFTMLGRVIHTAIQAWLRQPESVKEPQTFMGRPTNSLDTQTRELAAVSASKEFFYSLAPVERFRFPRWREFWTRDITSSCVGLLWRHAFKMKFRRSKQTWKQSFWGWPLTCGHDVTFRRSRSGECLSTKPP